LNDLFDTSSCQTQVILTEFSKVPNYALGTYFNL
jgi:hypothetical protein